MANLLRTLIFSGCNHLYSILLFRKTMWLEFTLVYQAISDGWFVILKPMTPGEHEIKTYAGSVEPGDIAQTNKVGFVTDTTINIIVK